MQCRTGVSARRGSGAVARTVAKRRNVSYSSVCQMPESRKTLLIEYTPRGNESRTRALREYFTGLIAEAADITVVDLAEKPPQVPDHRAMAAYYKRNHSGQTLSRTEAALLKQADAYRDALSDTEILIICCPMYNFGLPGAVKTWIDLAVQRGVAFDSGADGHVPKLGHLKVLFIYTTGMTYDQIARNFDWNGIENSSVNLFRFMGAEEVRAINVQGEDMLTPESVAYRTEFVAKRKFNELALRWYGIDQGLPLYSRLRNQVLRIEQGKAPRRSG